MRQSQSNSKIVILGGGTAGWLTGLFIRRNWPTAEVTIVEDPKRPPIIAGESGTTTFVSLMGHLKIDMATFIKEVNATPKLGGKFTDWNGVGTEFIHALQTDYAPWLDGWTNYVNQCSDDKLTMGALRSIMSAERAKNSYQRTLVGNDIPLADALYATYFIKENKVPFGATSELPIVPMWHFESRGAAAFFKKLGIERGINLVEGEYQNATQNNKGDISSITLVDGRKLAADWFFDCSGFARLLLGKVLNEPIVDYTNYFPARSVVAWWDEPCPCVTTNATAMQYGWSWNINIRHRSGNGYIFDPDYITLDQAIDEASARFNKKIEPIANFTFTPGMMRNAWRNNVFAIGLSSGFLEPLEANGVAVIIESLYSLQDYWNPDIVDYGNHVRNTFNDRVWSITEDIRDFLALHYRGKRSDTEFWKSHNNDDFRIPESLKEKLELWSGFYNEDKPEPYWAGYSPFAWMMVIQGLRIFDHSNIANIHKTLLPLGKEVINMNEKRYKALVEPHWTIEEWLKRTA